MAIKLSVVIPCYNEEKRFEKSIDYFLRYLKNQKYMWELIMVNDGSNDRTLSLMQLAADKNKKVKVITYKKNHGKGYAIKKGVQQAKGKIILFSDLDQAVPINTIENMFDLFGNGVSVVIGSRRVKGAKIINHQHPLREFLGLGFSLLVRLLIDWKIKDATCGFKAFKNSVAKKIFSKVTIYGWAFDAELLYLCKIYDIKLAQAPVAWTDVKGSKVNVMKDIISSLTGLVKIRLNDYSRKNK